MITIRSAKVSNLPSSAYLDCRGIVNPHRDKSLRQLDGRDIRVQDYVMADDQAKELLRRATALAPRTGEVTFACFGGKHRSVALAELLRSNLKRLGYESQVIHEELHNVES